MSNYTAEEICAKLTTGSCARSFFPQLRYDSSLKEKVKIRLDQAGVSHQTVHPSFSIPILVQLEDRGRILSQWDGPRWWYQRVCYLECYLVRL